MTLSPVDIQTLVCSIKLARINSSLSDQWGEPIVKKLEQGFCDAVSTELENISPDGQESYLRTLEKYIDVLEDIVSYENRLQEEKSSFHNMFIKHMEERQTDALNKKSA
jgi:hypothetical protein